MSDGIETGQMQAALRAGAIQWQRHALERMAERGIRRRDVVNALIGGERIEDYPADTPFPSALFLGWVQASPLHVVAAFDARGQTVYVITAYEPSPSRFGPDFKTRRKDP